MSVSFDKIKMGRGYERPFLADLWGYKGFQAISRGVVTPYGTNYVILFVTKEKQEALTQYDDYLDGDILHWEGEEKHSSDARIINSSNTNDEIHLFYRDIHHSPFIYYGKIFLKDYQRHADRPSRFTFSVGKSYKSLDLIDDIESHQNDFKTLDKTEQESIVKSRIGQGVFRDGLIKLWGGCSVTGLSNLSLLRASHVKPWRDCSNHERLDPMNGLLLHPALDHLFDVGFITFDNDGSIRISSKLSESDVEILHISRGFKLRKMPDGLAKYLRYHRGKVFNHG
jgi:putative restriction endonuclease